MTEGTDLHLICISDVQTDYLRKTCMKFHTQHYCFPTPLTLTVIKKI